ncbi:hypothetical protein ACFOMD_17260 [Sphingoaurantiacus capsulatus]|uniref:Restriction endonuclease n=1 Tax=Sphingoaurantiacus capsulatus TaxID=1771310 RepID=A0ABV7XEG3_9SPHN
MQIDIDAMREIAESMYVPHARRHFGSSGTEALRQLVTALRRIYRDLDPSLYTGTLMVVARPDGADTTSSLGTPIHNIGAGQPIQHQIAGNCAVNALPNGRLEIYNLLPDAIQLSHEAVVYAYSNRVERMFIGGEIFTIPNPSPAAMASIFARPTFSSLDAALARYATHVVNKTICFILAHHADGIWAEQNRLFLRAKPEEVMRRSLHQFLRDAFPDAEVRPEQIVDESHPVDIKVTWADTTHRAIIEIKWLGDSVDAAGKITTIYRDARANEGAKQLSDYLDADSATAPRLRTRGYLVVFDARRRGLTESQSTIDHEKGHYYRDRDINYDPDYHAKRLDFANPVRMFAEPQIS